MKKFKKMYILFILSFVLLTPLLISESNVSAQNNSFTEKIDNMEITIYNDGRVAPVYSSGVLKEETIDKILKKMNFTSEDIKNMPYNMKAAVLKNGGKKANSTPSDIVSIYTDLNGKDHIVTEQNQNKIQKLVEKDIAKYYSKDKKENFTILVDSPKKIDGIWSGWSTILYNGTVNYGKEYEYSIFSRYNWNGYPSVYFTDYVALSWQSNATPTSTSFIHYWTNGPYIINSYGPTEVDNSSLTGDRWGFDILGSGDTQYGWGRETIRIPVSDEGLTGVIAAGYSHPYSNSVVTAVLGSASIQWDGSWAMKHTWRQNFIIGK